MAEAKVNQKHSNWHLYIFVYLVPRKQYPGENLNGAKRWELISFCLIVLFLGITFNGNIFTRLFCWGDWQPRIIDAFDVNCSKWNALLKVVQEINPVGQMEIYQKQNAKFCQIRFKRPFLFLAQRINTDF